MRSLLLAVTIAAVLVLDGAPSRPGGVDASSAERPRIVAIGDSVTGTGTAAPNGWLKQYARTIGADPVTNLAVNGWFSYQILDALRHDPAFRLTVSQAGVIALNAGMNEFFTGRDLYSKAECGGSDNERCLRHMVARFNRNWDEIVREVRSLAPDTSVIVLTLYHPLEVFDQHFGWADALNKHLAYMNRHVAATEGVAVADLHRAFNGESGLEDPIAKGYILPDAIHATDLGHGVIARAVLGLGVRGTGPANRPAPSIAPPDTGSGGYRSRPVDIGASGPRLGPAHHSMLRTGARTPS